MILLNPSRHRIEELVQEGQQLNTILEVIKTKASSSRPDPLFGPPVVMPHKTMRDQLI